jgi:hypothetical protein
MKTSAARPVHNLYCLAEGYVWDGLKGRVHDWFQPSKPNARLSRQARHRMKGKDGFVRDFAAVFHDQDRKRVSFKDENAVARSG